MMTSPIAKIDFASDFLQTGDAKYSRCHSYLRMQNQSFYWFLIASAYGLVSANAKWKEHSDHLFAKIGSIQSHFVLQLFFSRE